MSFEDAQIGCIFGGVAGRNLDELLRPYYETENEIFVNAGLEPNLAMPEQSTWDLYWEFFDSPEPHISGKTMICGHTSQKTGHPISVGHAICIDTYVYGKGGWLTALNVDTREYIQTNEDREIRNGLLRSPKG